MKDVVKDESEAIKVQKLFHIERYHTHAHAHAHKHTEKRIKEKS